MKGKSKTSPQLIPGSEGKGWGEAWCAGYPLFSCLKETSCPSAHPFCNRALSCHSRRVLSWLGGREVSSCVAFPWGLLHRLFPETLAFRGPLSVRQSHQDRMTWTLPVCVRAPFPPSLPALPPPPVTPLNTLYLFRLGCRWGLGEKCLCFCFLLDLSS